MGSLIECTHVQEYGHNDDLHLPPFLGENDWNACMAAELCDGKVVSVTGNTCPRVKVYAETECVAPMRTITTTVRCKNGEMLHVKTASPIPKEKMAEAMEIINKANPDLPICVGDVIEML